MSVSHAKKILRFLDDTPLDSNRFATRYDAEGIVLGELIASVLKPLADAPPKVKETQVTWYNLGGYEGPQSVEAYQIATHVAVRKLAPRLWTISDPITGRAYGTNTSKDVALRIAQEVARHIKPSVKAAKASLLQSRRIIIERMERGEAVGVNSGDVADAVTAYATYFADHMIKERKEFYCWLRDACKQVGGYAPFSSMEELLALAPRGKLGLLRKLCDFIAEGETHYGWVLDAIKTTCESVIAEDKRSKGIVDIWYWTVGGNKRKQEVIPVGENMAIYKRPNSRSWQVCTVRGHAKFREYPTKERARQVAEDVDQIFENIPVSIVSRNTQERFVELCGKRIQGLGDAEPAFVRWSQDMQVKGAKFVTHVGYGR